MYGKLWNNLLQWVGDLININIGWDTTNLGSTKTMVLFLMDVEEDNKISICLCSSPSAIVNNTRSSRYFYFVGTLCAGLTSDIKK
jgi:hypothetical protein